MNAPARSQSYANHSRKFPLPYLLAGIVLFAEWGRRVWMAFQHPSLLAVWAVFVVAAVLVLWWQVRMHGLRVQDRVIRLEMRVRLERLFGSGRRGDIERLTVRQLIALRFARDAELPALVDEVLAGRLVKPDDIKRRVKDWQADWLRV